MAAVTRAARWPIFVPLVAAVVVLDQLAKAWVLGNVAPGDALQIVGPWIRLVLSRNTGGLFGLFQGNAPLFAVVSMAVMALIVAYEWRVGAGYVPSIALGLLLGGAVGNFIDRIRIGYVVDFVDMGIGDIRWYTFNVADAAISTALVLLLLMAIAPRLAEMGAATAEPATPPRGPSGAEARSEPEEAPPADAGEGERAADEEAGAR